MKRELTMNEMMQVAGGMIDMHDLPRISSVKIYIDSTPELANRDALSARMREMECDDTIWTYDGVMAELLAVDPTFQCA